MAGDEARLIRQQPADRVRHLFWPAQAVHRVHGGNRRLIVVVVATRQLSGDDVGLDRARCDTIDAKSLCRVIKGGRLGQTRDRMLRRRIRSAPRNTVQSGNRR